MSVVRYQCLFSPLEKLPAFEQLTEELTRGNHGVIRPRRQPEGASAGGGSGKAPPARC